MAKLTSSKRLAFAFVSDITVNGVPLILILNWGNLWYDMAFTVEVE